MDTRNTGDNQSLTAKSLAVLALGKEAVMASSVSSLHKLVMSAAIDKMTQYLRTSDPVATDAMIGRYVEASQSLLGLVADPNVDCEQMRETIAKVLFSA